MGYITRQWHDWHSFFQAKHSPQRYWSTSHSASKVLQCTSEITGHWSRRDGVINKKTQYEETVLSSEPSGTFVHLQYHGNKEPNVTVACFKVRLLSHRGLTSCARGLSALNALRQNHCCLFFSHRIHRTQRELISNGQWHQKNIWNGSSWLNTKQCMGGGGGEKYCILVPFFFFFFWPNISIS